MMSRFAMSMAALALGGVAAGAVAGMDAGGSIDGFYAASPTPRYRTPIVLPDPSTGWDGATSATYAATTPLALDELDRDDLPLSEAFDHRPPDDSPPVRIHRASIDQGFAEDTVVAAPEPARNDDAEDGWVDAPAAGDTEPAR